MLAKKNECHLSYYASKSLLQCLPNDDPILPSPTDDGKDLRKQVTRASCLACKPPHHYFEMDQAISYQHMSHACLLPILTQKMSMRVEWVVKTTLTSSIPLKS